MRHLGEGQGQYGKIDAGTPQRDEADDDCDHDQAGEGDQHRRYDVRRQVLQRQTREVSGGAEEGGMAEREVTGETEQDVETECEDSPDHDLGCERLVAVDPYDPFRHRQNDGGKDSEHEKIPTGKQPGPSGAGNALPWRSEEHTSELQSLMRISYAVFCLKKKSTKIQIGMSLLYTKRTNWQKCKLS